MRYLLNILLPRCQVFETMPETAGVLNFWTKKLVAQMRYFIPRTTRLERNLQALCETWRLSLKTMVFDHKSASEEILKESHFGLTQLLHCISSASRYMAFQSFFLVRASELINLLRLLKWQLCMGMIAILRLICLEYRKKMNLSWKFHEVHADLPSQLLCVRANIVKILVLLTDSGSGRPFSDDLYILDSADKDILSD